MVRINLLPREYRPKPLVEFNRLFLLLFLTFFIFGVLVFSGREYYRYKFLKDELALLEKELSLYDSSLQEINRIKAFKKAFLQEKEEINKVKCLYQPIMEILYGVSNVLPEDLWLTEIQIDRVNTVRIQGDTLSIFSIGELLNQINSLPSCKNSRLKSINQNNSNNITTFSFSIEFETGRAELEYARD